MEQASEQDLWCSGLRFAKRRALSQAERDSLSRELAAGKRRASVGRWLGRLGFAIFGIGVGAAISIARKHNDALIERETAWFGLALFAPAFLGTLNEIAGGSNKKLRIFFSLAAACVALGIWGQDFDPSAAWVGALMGVGMLTTLFGGWASVIVRWKLARETSPVLALAQEDLTAGEVQCFGATPDGGGLVEVLPKSRAAFMLGGVRHRGWDVMYVAQVAHAPDHAPEAPWYDAPTNLPASAPDFKQRHLTTEEADEISRLLSPMLRRGLLRFVGVTYFAAVILRFVENLARHQLEPTLSPFGWALAFGAGIWELVRVLRLRNGLQHDAEERMAVVAHRPKSTMTLLPKSGLIWDRNGRPAGWRTRRWW